MTTIRPALVITVFLASALPAAMPVQPAGAQTAPAGQIRRIYGTIVGVDLSQKKIAFRTRNGKTVMLDISQAAALQQAGVLPLNKPVALWGVRGPDKVFHVQSIGHTAPTQRDWGDDDETGD
jgi:hypothetical protein